MHFYDDFRSHSLDPSRWRFLEYPQPVEGIVRCAEASAETTVGNGELCIRIPRFQNAHDSHQNIDNCKHLILSCSTIALPAKGRATFRTRMAVTGLGTKGRDYRDGFVSFNVLDFTTGMVFDVCATPERFFSIYERLPLPGVGTPFTHIIDAPLCGIEFSPGQPQDCAVSFDLARRTCEWRVNDVLMFIAHEVQVPQAVTLGLGFITLHPLCDGRSHSLCGQGMEATWGAIAVDFID